MVRCIRASSRPSPAVVSATLRVPALCVREHDAHTGYTRAMKGGTMSALSDMAKAKGMRELAKAVKDPVAKQTFEDAAMRLEKRAAKGAGRIARRKRKRASVLGER